MSWTQAAALVQFRRVLGDTTTDKFNFKIQGYPEADGTTKVFHFGETRLVTGSLIVYLDGTLQSSGYTEDLAKGSIEFSSAPARESDIQASFHYQWFTDDQLITFLEMGANTMGMEDEEDANLPIGLRSALIHFACYFAYMNKAAETADSLVAGAEGFEVDQSKSFPNWKRMAENAWEAATKAVDFYNENPLTVGGIGIAFVGYKLPDYLPRS